MSTQLEPPPLGMARASSVWWIAYAASILAHAGLLFGVPQIEFSLTPVQPPKPLEARIVQAPAHTPEPQAVIKPAPKPVAAPKPRPKPRPKPVPPAPISLPDPTPPAPVIAQSEAPQDDTAIDSNLVVAEAPVTPALSEGTSNTQAPEAAPTPAADTPAVAVEPVPAPVPAGPPTRYPVKAATLIYDLSYGENPMRVGRVTHRWSNDGERYFAETVVEATGLFSLLYGGQYVQRSWGSFGPAGLVPSEYFVQRGRPDRGETAQFDWESKKVAFQWRGERRAAILAPGTQDPISMLHQIFFLQPLPESKTLNVATSRKFGQYLFQFLGEERIDTPMGELTALHVRRKDDDADHVDVWVDPQRGFLPVRVHFVDRRGYVFDQRVREMQFEPAN